jgi:pyruvate dehydrogenase E2 component (dihydrolipoamide acetyltransferase)
MAFEILVPRLGWTMEEGVFRGWCVKDGETIRQGEPLFTLETDKALQEVEAVEEGILRIRPPAPADGATVKVGLVLGWLLAPGEEPPIEAAGKDGGARAPAAPAAAAAGATATIASGLAAPSEKREGRGDLPAISPRARRIAAELGVDPTKLRGSGKSGRIAERDVRAAAAAAPSVARGIPGSVPGIQEMSPLRRATAEAVARSARSIVPVTLMAEADATDLVARRSAEGEAAPGLTAVFVRIAALALAEHPRLNCRWAEGGFARPKGIHVAFAVEVEDGLLAPAVHDADRKPLEAIDREVRDLARKARDRRAGPADLEGATFTVSNLGSCGIDGFTPVVAPGQGAILGTGRIADRPAVRDGRVVPRKLVTLSLTFDHRVVDGAPAGRFLARIRELVERPDIFWSKP